MILDAYLYGDPAETLDRLRAERARAEAAEKKKEDIRLRDKRRRIKRFMKKLRITKAKK